VEVLKPFRFLKKSRIRETATWSAKLKVLSGGMPWRWWCRPTAKKKELAGTFPHMHRQPRCTKLGFNHFFKGGDGDSPADIVYFQGHASPGIYARSFLEGRLTKTQLENFRRELNPDGGLSSYPHPRLMDEYWQFPTVSMGLSPIMAIYQARFNKYLQDKGMLDAPRPKSVGISGRWRNG
jgi:pyruvate dehydrogenase E1 component